jgi:hypothetical protein
VDLLMRERFDKPVRSRGAGTGPAEKQTFEARTVGRSITSRIEEFTVTDAKNEWWTAETVFPTMLRERGPGIAV